MRGLMMDRPLLISSLIQYAAEYHGDTEIVTRTVEGPIHRYTYAEAETRSKQLANAMKRLGIGMGDRVATWLEHVSPFRTLLRHLRHRRGDAHTQSAPLPGPARYMVNHAEDKIMFLDLTFVPLAEKMAAHWPTVKHYIILTDRAHMPQTSLPNVLCYEELLAAEKPELTWPMFDENTASSLCYTSGTTGNPKGSLYTHRSTVLAQHGRVHRQRDRLLGRRLRAADRADVPRQCLGRALQRALMPARSWCCRARSSTAPACAN